VSASWVLNSFVAPLVRAAFTPAGVKAALTKGATKLLSTQDADTEGDYRGPATVAPWGPFWD